MLILAFDTATDVATSALVDDEQVLGERTSLARTVLVDADALLREAGRSTEDIDALVVGTGPGSFTSTRMGIAYARGLALSLEAPVAGVSTLDALARGAQAEGIHGALPVVDARRREVFVPGPRAIAPGGLEIEPGTICIGSGAVRYRHELEELGAEIPPDHDGVHVPHARFHASLAEDFGSPEHVVPIYVRVPDVEVPA